MLHNNAESIADCAETNHKGTKTLIQPFSFVPWCLGGVILQI
jgi:hypothetical protein